MKRIYDGLMILLKYEPDGDCAAEHDVFYAGSIDPKEITPEDLKALETLGWFYDNTLESWLTFI